MLFQLLERIGWMLLHSIWQILLIAGVYAVVSLRLRSANARYAAGWAALLLAVLVPAATLIFIEPSSDMHRAAAVHLDSPNAAPNALVRTSSSDRSPTDREPNSITEAHAVSEQAANLETADKVRPLPGDSHSWITAVESMLPMVVGLWLLGVVVLSLRPIFGFWHLKRLRRHGLSPVSAQVTKSADDIACRIGLRRSIAVAKSELIAVPLVIGIIRPLLLLSPSALACLSPRQLEAVLAHELAHIRRHDFLANLMQMLVETLLFYHPAIWWISRRIREERENCCDDLAVALLGDRVGYAEMLCALEKSCRVPQLAPAASGGSLLNRIRRIAAPENARSLKQASALLGGMMMFFASCLIAVCLAAFNGILIAGDDADRQVPASAPAETLAEEENIAKPGENAGPVKSDTVQEDVDAYDQQGFTQLHRASIGGRLEDVSTLIDEGADVNVRQKKFQGTPLQYAAAGGHKQVVEMLIGSGATVDAADTFGRTPLMWAASKGQTDVVKVLLENKADVKAETKTGWTPLRYAVQSGKADLVKLFKGKVSLDALDKDGFSMLHRAASGGHAGEVKILIEAGADVNVRQKKYQGTPLQYAADEGHAEVVRMLLKADADVNATDTSGRTPLMWAAAAGKKEVVEALLSEDAHVNVKTKTGWTALRYAQDKGHEKVADVLIEHGAKETP